MEENQYVLFVSLNNILTQKYQLKKGFYCVNGFARHAGGKLEC